MQIEVPNTLLSTIERNGLATLTGVFDAGEVAAMQRDLGAVLAADCAGAAIRAGEGTIYAARNLLEIWADAKNIWRKQPLPQILAEILGSSFGLVRALYFDKPPGHSWTLPWHKDLTIAVRDNSLPSSHFEKPTRKAGVPHVEAPQWLLERVLTARIHLDDVTDENGPLRVVPGSHRAGKDMAAEGTPRTLYASAGDVLLIRPLVAHASGRSLPETALHRRILHLEFSGEPNLPDGYAWRHFVT